MNWSLFFQLLVTAAVAFAGAALAHYFSAIRDRANARRDQRIAFLVDAYRRLEFVSNRPELDDAKPIESAMADIQLFGSAKQVRLVQEFITTFAANKSGSLDIVLKELRNDLRAELKLENIPGDLLFLRFPPRPTGKVSTEALNPRDAPF